MNTTKLNITSRNVSSDNLPRLEDILAIFRIQGNISVPLFSIISALGIIGNGLVIWIAGFRMKKAVSAVWFLNLAVADFICCASLPLRIVYWLTPFSYSIMKLCLLSGVLYHLNMSASVLILTAMSIDRWVSVTWPFWAKVHRTLKIVRITVAIIWIFSLIFSGSVLMLYVTASQYGFQWCIFGPWFTPELETQNRPIIHLIRLVMMFVIPFLIISISYVSIFFKLRKSKRPQRSQRISRIVTAVILCFLICWTPYYIWPLTKKYFNINLFTVFLMLILDTIVTTLSYLNSCINPIIYVFMSQDFQHSFLKSIPFRLENAFQEQPNDQCEEQGDSGSTHITPV